MKVLTGLLNLLSYPRAIVITIFAAVHTMIMSVIILCVAATVRNRHVIDWFIIWWWSLPIVYAAGGRVQVTGGENVGDQKKGFLILFNHSSFMDIPILYAYFPRSFRFGAKIELFKIPFFGKAMELCGVLPIDRGNRNKVMEVYKNAIARIHNGESFALAPEGTRQAQTSLGRFKRGPFEFAINAQMDIVPVVLAGAYDMLTKNSVLLGAGKWRHNVRMQILPRVSTEGLTSENLDALVEKVRGQMDPVYQQLIAQGPG